MDQVINHNDILQFPIRNNPQILDEETILGLHAIFAMQHSVYGFLLLVEVGNNGLCVILSACCEDIDGVVLTHIAEKL